MKVTFCGHSEIHKPEAVREWLYKEIETLIQEGADLFLLGGYGVFDQMAASIVWELRKEYSQIQSVLVKPYLNREIDESNYNWTVYPALEKVPPRYAITHRNRYMIDQADVIVVYVQHSWGGAAQTLAYAKQKKKKIILFNE